jgi:hypothetical protein
MTILYLEGFEGAGTTEGSSSGADMRKYLEARSDSSSFQTSTNGSPRVSPGWGSGKALSWGDDGNGDINTYQIDLASSLSTFYFGFAVKPWNQSGRDPELLRLRRSANNRDQMKMRFVNGSTLQFYKETFGTWYTSPVILKHGEWQYVEIKVTFHASAGTLDIRINGTTVVSETGLDNDSFGDTDFDELQLWGGEGTGVGNLDQQVHIDDVYLSDSGFLGPIKVEGLLPTAEGATINFTPSAGTDNSANADENPRNDDTDYNSSADTASNKDLLAAGNLSNITGNIVAVQITADCKLDAAGSIGMQGIVAEGTPTQGTGPVVEVTNTTDYVAVQAIFETNPDTASAWSTTEVDAMEIGYEVD